MVDTTRRSVRTAVLLLALTACTRERPGGFETVELVHRVTGRQERETISWSSDGMRYQRPDGIYLLRFADRTVFILNEEEKRYEELSLEKFVARQKKTEHQPDVPDLARSLGGDPAIHFEPTSQKTEIGGVEAILTRIRSEAFDVEMWMTEAITPPGPPTPSFQFLQALGGPLALPAEVYGYVDGFPVRSTVRVRGGMFGEIKVTRALVSLDRTAPPAATFSVPDGYRKTS